MSVLAGFLRERAQEDMRRMTALERIRLALALGDDDLRLFGSAAGLSTDQARQRLVVARQHGRRFSASASRP